MGSVRSPVYRQKAAECLQMAKKDGLKSEERSRWLELAEQWQKLADGVEKPTFDVEIPYIPSHDGVDSQDSTNS